VFNVLGKPVFNRLYFIAVCCVINCSFFGMDNVPRLGNGGTLSLDITPRDRATDVEFDFYEDRWKCFTGKVELLKHNDANYTITKYNPVNNGLFLQEAEKLLVSLPNYQPSAKKKWIVIHKDTLILGCISMQHFQALQKQEKIDLIPYSNYHKMESEQSTPQACSDVIKQAQKLTQRSNSLTQPSTEQQDAEKNLYDKQDDIQPSDVAYHIISSQPQESTEKTAQENGMVDSNKYKLSQMTVFNGSAVIIKQDHEYRISIKPDNGEIISIELDGLDIGNKSTHIFVYNTLELGYAFRKQLQDLQRMASGFVKLTSCSDETDLNNIIKEYVASGDNFLAKKTRTITTSGHSSWVASFIASSIILVPISLIVLYLYKKGIKF